MRKLKKWVYKKYGYCIFGHDHPIKVGAGWDTLIFCECGRMDFVYLYGKECRCKYVFLVNPDSHVEGGVVCDTCKYTVYYRHDVNP